MRIYGTEDTLTLTEELGRRLRGMRVRSSLTQNELAKRAGVPKAVITKAENGIPVRLDSLLELMRALGCLGNLQVLLPEDELSAAELLHNKTPRMRVRHSDRKKDAAGGWKWGDET